MPQKALMLSRKVDECKPLVAGGKAGIYTVMYFTAAKKPLK